MLSEEEKHKIILEERLRFETKEELQNQSKKQNRAIAFFNTNLGLFLLSTILVGGISFSYNYFREKEIKRIEQLDLERQRLFTKNKLLDEVVHRFKILQLATDTLVEYRSKDIYLALKGNSVESPLKAEYYNFKSVYGEYAAWSIQRLLRELSLVEENPENLEQIKDLLYSFSENTESLNHLSENFYLVTNKGRYLPKGTQIKVYKGKDMKYRGRSYYLKDEKYYYLDRGEKISRKFFKLDQNEKINKLVELIRKYLTEANMV
ncbi:hypothetical protein KFE98_01520 [bacterium SCSIO 12741]|nr:hypothetical protein KFE98_01520 [bacterium SCSIO 12741]